MTRTELHINTASLLLEGIAESMSQWQIGADGKPKAVNLPPEHSKESVIRRCVQIRQELIRVIQELQ